MLMEPGEVEYLLRSRPSGKIRRRWTFNVKDRPRSIGHPNRCSFESLESSLFNVREEPADPIDLFKCEQVMSQQQRSVIAANHAAVEEDLDLNFGRDRDITEVDSLHGTKTFDAVVFDVLKVPPEDIANQLTLIDIGLFQKIELDELTSCAWTSKKKHELCSNVVNCTSRFNHVSFWVTREILNANTAKTRAEKVAYFIKVARKLLDLNNLNSLKAVLSSLQSAPIHRLSLTWNMVPKRDKDKLDKLSELITEDHNRVKLRDYLKTARLPCIPFLGMYLTDLTYINTIYPCTGGLDINRNNKMNEILRTISDFQQSHYEIVEEEHIKKYLLSIRYIDELQNFMEDENFKLSLSIEPSACLNVPKIPDANISKEKEIKRPRDLFLESDDSVRSRLSQLNPKAKSLTLAESPFRSPSPDKRTFVPGHRKAKSLGSHSQVQTALCGHLSSTGSSVSSAGSRSLLDDSFVEEGGGESSTSLIYDSEADRDEPESHPIIQSFGNGRGDLTPHLPEAYFKLQGFLKRKTHLKGGSKPKVNSWQRFWVGISGSHLVYFLPKYRGFGGHERSNFRPDPHKTFSLTSSICTIVGNDLDSDMFQLTDDSGDNVYRFRAGSNSNANIWVKYIREAAEDLPAAQPRNLITFDDADDENTML